MNTAHWVLAWWCVFFTTKYTKEHKEKQKLGKIVPTVVRKSDN